MAQNRKQHFVQRAYIDRFADEAGRLLAYCKQQNRILNLGHPCDPKDILYGKNYYSDAVGDFDFAFNAPVENTFRKWYDPLVASHSLASLDKDAFGWFLLWAANHLTRTQYMADVVTAMREGGGLHDEKPERNAFINRIRCRMFQSWIKKRDMGTWRTMHLPVPPRLLVTDNPVCETGLPGTSRTAIVVPVTKDLIVVGGDPEVVERVFSWSIVHLNLFLAGWSQRLTYSGDRLALELLKSTFDGAVRDIPEGYLRQARLPYFGTAEMMALTYRAYKEGSALTCVTLADEALFPIGQVGQATQADGPCAPA